MRVETLTSTKDLLYRPPRKPLTAMSRRAPSDETEDRLARDSPDRGCKSGSVLTS